MTYIMVTGRQGGKTAAMIQWLLAGHSIDRYPGWSRVILCPTDDQVHYLTSRVRRATDSMMIAGPDMWNICKAIWSTHDLISVQKHHGTRDLEFGVDNAERVIESILHQELSFITMTGTLVPHG